MKASRMVLLCVYLRPNTIVWLLCFLVESMEFFPLFFRRIQILSHTPWISEEPTLSKIIWFFECCSSLLSFVFWSEALFSLGDHWQGIQQWVGSIEKGRDSVCLSSYPQSSHMGHSVFTCICNQEQLCKLSPRSHTGYSAFTCIFSQKQLCELQTLVLCENVLLLKN